MRHVGKALAVLAVWATVVAMVAGPMAWCGASWQALAVCGGIWAGFTSAIPLACYMDWSE
jgi:hypothetical protein